MPHIELRRDRLAELCADAGLLNQNGDIVCTRLADRLGVNQSTVNRCLEGVANPGEKLIASLLRAFPGTAFPDLFSVVDSDAA